MPCHRFVLLSLLLVVILASCTPAPSGEKGEGLFPACQGQKCGYIDNKGNVVIDFQFDWAYPFSSDGIAAIQMGKKVGFIDQQGKIVIDPVLDPFGFWDFSEGWTPVLVNKLCGYINTKGEVEIYPKLSWAFPFHENYAIVETPSGERGYIDKNGNFYPANVKLMDTSRVGLVYPVQPFTPLEALYEAEDTPGGISPQDSEFAGLVEVPFPARLMGGCHGFLEGVNAQTILVRGVFGFSEGLAIVSGEEGYGYIQPSGEMVISPVFEDAHMFSEGLAAVQVNGRWGFIDKTGQFVVPPSFEDAGHFSEGFANVALEDKWGYIDTAGNIVIKPQFSLAEPFSEGIAIVGKEAGDSLKLGLVDKTGAFVVKPKYFDICYMGLGVWQVWKDRTTFG